MNILIKLFHKNQFKMEKLNLLLSLHAHYSYAENKDEQRLAKIAAGIDKMTDDLIKDIKIEPAKPAVEQNKSTAAPAAKSETAKPAAKTQKEIDAEKRLAREAKEKSEKEAALIAKAAKEAIEKAAAEVETPDEGVEAVNESLIEVSPFYPCKVMAKGAKYAKDIKAKPPRTFKAWKDEESAKAAKGEGLYPDVDLLELVLDGAWDMACEGKSGREILEFCQKELKGFYPELKSNSDWYGKLVNPIVGMVQFIKKAFGYKSDDPSVKVTRPVEENYQLEADSDCTVSRKGAEEAAKPAEKPAMKTVQESAKAAKPAEKKAEPVVHDEEQEEKELEGVEAPEETEETDDLNLEIEAEEEEVDHDNPPAVSEFDDFNDFEKLVFDKILEGAQKAAKKGISEADKKAIQAENRDEVRNLIASNFDGDSWVEKTEDGKWSAKLIGYHNAIITELSKNKAKWSVKA